MTFMKVVATLERWSECINLKGPSNFIEKGSSEFFDLFSILIIFMYFESKSQNVTSIDRNTNMHTFYKKKFQS